MDERSRSRARLLHEIRKLRQRNQELEAQLAAHQLLEAELRHCRSQLGIILHSISDGVIMEDAAGQIIYANAPAARALDYPSSVAMLGKAMAEVLQHVEILDEEGRPIASQRMPGTLALQGAHAPASVVRMRVRSSGEERWTVLRAAPVLDRQGRALSAISILSDITERKRVEKAFRLREARFRALIEHSTDMIALLDPSGTILYASPSTSRILGYSVERFVGRDVFEIIHPEDRAETIKLLQQVTQQPGSTINTQFRLQHKDGAWRWVEGTATNLLAEPSVRAIVANYRDITERKSVEEQLLHNAFYDPVTGLANRLLFLERLEHAVAHARRHPDYTFAVLFLDLDRFKEINDRFGHLSGDYLLAAVARRLQSGLRPSDTAARFGGDEFAILLEDIGDVQRAMSVADRIHQELAAPFILSAHEVSVTTSIGIAMSGSGYERPEEVLHDADMALYHAKARGKARYEVFKPASQPQAGQPPQSPQTQLPMSEPH